MKLLTEMGQTSPRVVMIVPAYLPESFGGAEQQTRRLAETLVRRGAAVTVLAPRLKRSTPSRQRDGAVLVRRFLLRTAPNLGGRHIESFLLWSACIFAWLWRHRREYDLIHVIHGRLHAFPAAVAGKRLAKPVLIKPGVGGDAHFDLAVVHRKRLLGSFFARGIVRNATAWVSISQEIEEDLVRWGVPRRAIYAIPNGVAIPGGLSPRTQDGDVQVLSMGRLAPEKSVDQSIRAFADVAADTARFTILGDGPSRSELEALSRRIGQERRIAFPGAVEDVTPYLREADIYLSSSVSEGMSNALLEAMSYGVVPVVSQVSGAADLVEEGVSGFLYPPGDETALAALLEDVLTMTAERRSAVGTAARAAVARFSLDKVAERHWALYCKLISAGAADSKHDSTHAPLESSINKVSK